MRLRTVIAVAITALTLAACSSNDSSDDTKPSASASASQQDDPAKAAGLPPEPTGADREELLRALRAANPDLGKHEDKAIDAARNQCMAINGGAQNLDYFASQRFTFEDVTTTEAQGKQINEALKGLKFCEV
ncbi:hypothetical protein [Streptomyces sp.]|uniref:hypothetical protein n=1 Tax=Streptomyces sp. TaxID=1931 RepID=UPI002D266382|nr:hypothetical protein [Streptomyces sp.]HZF92064.1 hypothetical protein [Streptomyces sp.]